MNSLWKTILDGLTYQDLAGKRQPRIYTVITGLILLLLFAAGGMAGLNRYLLMSTLKNTVQVVQARPVSVSMTTQVIESSETEPPATVQSEGNVSSGCPTDSTEWSFSPTLISENHQVIQPACVYQGLERTIAWALAVREGYSRAEATQQLGFTEMPMRQLGEIIGISEQIGTISCEMPNSSPPQHPCTNFSAGAGGITCENSGWNVSARVTFPEIYLDVRPYPATLVRWPTAVRNGGLPESSGSGGVDYIPNGGGSPGNPQVGDWQDLRLILTLRPAGPMFVTLPHIGDLVLPNGVSQSIQWEVPSHPAVGAGPLAGSIGGLEELPGDMPLFVGKGRAPYKLFWEMRYYEYEAIEECISGPNGNGNYNCGGRTGHKEVVGYEWKRHSSGGEIPPSAVANLPAALMADVNQDGTPDAYWDNNLTLRRMDEAGSVNNPQYQRSWNWGGIIYWAVREGQGQIGWPG